MSDFLFGLPTWVVVAGLIIVIGPSVIVAVGLCRAAALGDRQTILSHADKVDQRMRDLNHQDVKDRAGTRDFQSWNADDDLPA